MTKIKIFDAEIEDTMSLEEVLDICKKIKNTKINNGMDVEVTDYTYLQVNRNLTEKTQKSYEIIFHDGKIESVEIWDIEVLYSTVPRDDIRVMQT